MATETFSTAPRLGPIFVKSVLSRKSGGSTLPDIRLELTGHTVDRGHLLEYQRLCGFDGSDVLPHTYPHLLGFGLQAELMARPSFPLTLAGLVHVENTITVHRPITAADTLTIAVHAENLADHPKGRTVDLVTEVDVDGERVWDGRSTYLARGRSNPDAERRSQPPGIPRGFAVASWALPGDLGRRYAAVSGDVNPIHLHPLTAKAMGFPRAIAHGMWTYARVLGALGPKAAGPATSHVWFKKPVFLPSRVELVVDQRDGQVVAGLRSARNHDTEHLVLSVTR